MSVLSLTALPYILKEDNKEGVEEEYLEGVDLERFIDIISVLFVCLHIGLVSALLYLIYSKRTIRKEFRKNTWS